MPNQLEVNQTKKERNEIKVVSGSPEKKDEVMQSNQKKPLLVKQSMIDRGRAWNSEQTQMRNRINISSLSNVVQIQ